MTSRRFVRGFQRPCRITTRISAAGEALFKPRFVRLGIPERHKERFRVPAAPWSVIELSVTPYPKCVPLVAERDGMRVQAYLSAASHWRKLG